MSGYDPFAQQSQGYDPFAQTQGYDPFAPKKVERFDPFVGTMNNKTHGIDYSQYSNQGLTFCGIKVSWKEDDITGIELAYNGKPMGAVLGSKSQGSQEEVFMLDQGDAFIEIFGRYTDHVNSLYVKTLKGKSKTWGNPTLGEPFYLRAQNSCITALKIQADTFVQYIEGVYGSLLWLQARPWPISQQGPFTEHLRPTVNGDEECNDWDWVEDKFNWKMAKVSVWHDKQNVQGLQFHYHIDGTLKSPGQHVADTNDNTKKEVLTLEEGEYIHKVLIVQGKDWVSYICLVTNKGRKLEGGNPNSQGGVFVCTAPQNFQIASFRSEFSQNYRKLGFNFADWY